MKKYKILDHPWHLAHAWELQKLPFIEWDYMVNPYRGWADTIRDSKPNVNWVTHYEPGKYDAVLLHLDQQCVDPRMGKGQLYRQMNEAIQDIPKIVIMHGTTLYEPSDIKGLPDRDIIVNGGDVYRRGSTEPEHFDGIKQLVGDNSFICNSKQARDDFGWGEYIIHGLNVDDWLVKTKEPRACVSVAPAGMSEVYYGRRFLRSLKNILEEEYGIKLWWIGVDYQSTRDNRFGNAYDAYRDMLARSLIYINPTLDSPMPRARTEAMASGCCVLTTPQHGADEFIDNAKNGFIIDGKDPYRTARLVYELIENHFDEAVQIGRNARQTVADKLNHKQFADQWLKFLKKTIGEPKG